MSANDTHLTATSESPPDNQPVVVCSACPHPWGEHDQIAARFCAATTVGHHERGCVCTA